MVASRPTGQATLNASHALAGRLVHGYVFSEGTGTSRNIKQTTVNASAGGGAAWVTNAGGSAISTNPGYINSGLTTVPPQAPFHIVIGYRNATNSTEGQQAIVSNTLDGAVTYTNAACPLLWFYNGTDRWVIDGNANWSGGAAGSYGEWLDPAASVYTTGPHHLHLAVTATETTLYRNGTSLGAQGVVVPGTTAQPLAFGGNTFAWQNFRAEFDYVYIFSGTLTTGEIDELRTDPYALVSASTRFYLPSTGTVTVTPAFDAAWDDTSVVTRRPANTTKGTSAFVDIRDTEASALNTWDVALGQFVSAPIAAQTISGTVKGYIRAREEATGVNARSQMVVRVVSNDGTTVRGTLLPQDNTTTNVSEWVVATTANSATQSRNARFPTPTASSTLTSVTAQEGDRIVIEVGARCVNTATTATFAVAARFGENAADLAENETGVTEGAPWVEFSGLIQFSTGATPHVASGGMVSKKPQVSGTLTQTFPARSISGGLISKKPTAVGTLTQSAIAPHAVSGGMVSKKPVASGTLTQTFPARSISGSIVSPKPIASGTLTQSFPARSVSGALVSPKPVTSGTLTQTFPARSISGGAVSAKPTISGTLTQTFPARSFSGGLVSPKALISGSLTQSAISPHSVSGGTVSAKPRISGALSQGSISPHVLSGGAVSPKPIVDGTLTQTFPARSVSGALVSPKPSVAGTLTQTFPARSISGGLLSKKPTAVGTLTQSAISPHGISGGLVSAKPRISGIFSQGGISPHALLGSLASPKPIVSGTLTQTVGVFTDEFTDEFEKTPLVPSFSGALVSPKPQISGTLSPGGIASHSLLGGLVSPKPGVSGTLTQTFPARSFSGALVSAKPRISGDVVQTFPARSISGELASPRPAMAGQFFQGALFGYEFSGGLISAKPQIGGTLTQTLFPSNVSGSLVSAKPRIAGILTQTLLPNSFAGALVSPKPNMVGLIAQGEIGSSSFLAGLVSPKPRVSGVLTQSAIATQTFSGGLISAKPRISGILIQQALGGFELSGGLASPKPRVLGTLTQTFPSRFISGGMVSKKPTITAILTQTILPHAIGGGMVSPRPRLFGSFVQNLLTPHVISGGMVSPKPTMKAVRMADEYAVKVGIEYATKGQLALASGHLLLLTTDPEGELPMAHPIAIAQRTVEAGYGANPLTFEGPLDPAELKYFTVTWDTELQAAVDSIVPDNGTPEGQTVFLTLSGSAVAAGIQVHAFSQDERSVTFWLKVESSQQSRTQWTGVGELHVITIRIITTRGQVFERDISFRVKQL